MIRLKENKYRNKKTVVDGLNFQDTYEALMDLTKNEFIQKYFEKEQWKGVAGMGKIELELRWDLMDQRLQIEKDPGVRKELMTALQIFNLLILDSFRFDYDEWRQE